jgi:hypothetical protein
MKTSNKVALGVGAAVLALGLPYLLKLKRLSEELETVTKVNIHQVTLTGMKLRVDITLKNPTGASLKVKHPFVRMMHKDSVFASSESKDQDYQVPKFGEKQIDPVYVDLSFIQLATQAPELLQEYRKTGKLELIVKTVTTINNKIPYIKTDNINL